MGVYEICCICGEQTKNHSGEEYSKPICDDCIKKAVEFYIQVKEMQ